MKNNHAKKQSNFLIKAIARYNLVIFIVVVASGLIAAVLTLNSIVRIPFSDTYNSQSNGTTAFDQNTIDRINKLQTSDSNAVDQPLPSGRINPFSE